MPVHVALLRAINLGPRNKVAMPRLRDALEAAGFEDVVTHLNTGNVVLRTSRRSQAAVGEAVHAVLRDELAVPVAVIVRSGEELAQAAEHHFAGEPDAGPKALHVGFLQSAPPPEAAPALDDLDFGRERFALRDRDLHLLYPDGQGRSKMTAARFEKRLGVALTVRSVAVVRRLAELAGA